VVKLDKRAHNPFLVSSGLADKPTPMPWFEDKRLVIRFGLNRLPKASKMLVDSIYCGNRG